MKMITFSKQSLVDYQVLVNGEHHSWVKKTKAGYYWNVKAEFFKTLKAAKDYVKVTLK
jgi:hypothetical protein